MKALRCGYAAKGFLSLLGVISVFIELAFERLYHSVAQFLRRYFCRDLRVIVLRIVVAPLVVFVSADLTGMVLLGNSSPGTDQLRDTGSILPLPGINAVFQGAGQLLPAQ